MSEITRADIYKEQYAHFRSMNDILYKFLRFLLQFWVGFGTSPSLILRRISGFLRLVFAFAAIASVCFVNVMQRFRMAFNSGISPTSNEMDGDMKVSIKPSRLPRRSSQFSSCSGRPPWSPCLASFTPFSLHSPAVVPAKRFDTTSRGRLSLAFPRLSGSVPIAANDCIRPPALCPHPTETAPARKRCRALH